MNPQTERPSRWRFLIPVVDTGGWFGDGMHANSKVDGKCLEFSWVGLHFCFVIALERSW